MRDASLGVFVFIAFFTVAALIFDYILDKCGMKTISDFVWGEPIMGLPIILFELCAPISIGIHFYWKTNKMFPQ